MHTCAWRTLQNENLTLGFFYKIKIAFLSVMYIKVTLHVVRTGKAFSAQNIRRCSSELEKFSFTPTCLVHNIQVE